MEVLKIYCDGGCRGNGKENNIGSYGAVLIYNGKTKEVSGAVKNTTNNIMELTAAIEALIAVKKDVPIEVFCDSAYVVNGMNSWVDNWIMNGWRTSKKKPVENKELWQQLYTLKNSFSNIKFLKVKGHADDQWNNRADELCNLAMDEIMKESI